MKFLGILALSCIFTGAYADVKQDALNNLQAHTIKAEQHLKEELLKSNASSEEKELVMQEFETLANDNTVVINSLSEEEIVAAKIDSKPFHCFYDYSHHYPFTQLHWDVLNFETHPIGSSLGALIGLPLTFAVDTVMTPVSIGMALTEPHNEDVPKSEECL